MKSRGYLVGIAVCVLVLLAHGTAIAQATSDDEPVNADASEPRISNPANA